LTSSFPRLSEKQSLFGGYSLSFIGESFIAKKFIKVTPYKLFVNHGNLSTWRVNLLLPEDQ
jgi:hypothetical protein